MKPLKLKTISSNMKDVRSLIARVSRKNLKEFYGDISEYRDGKAVVIERNGKKVYAILQDPLYSKGLDDSFIRLDQWMRRRLDVKKNEEVTIKKTFFAPINLFWRTMVFRHPDLSQRWENFGIFLAIVVFLIDIFIQLVSWCCPPELLFLYVIGAFLFFLFVPPIILIPRK